MIRRMLLASLLSLTLAAPLLASKNNSNQNIDEGTFVIYVQGRRIGTEKFSIEQRSDMSVVTSEVRIEDGANKAGIGSELQLFPNGDLRHYDWKELNPGKGVTTVDYSESFLIEHVVPGPGEKANDLTFMIPPSTNVLDDYFFAHREVLLWKYMAAACAAAPDKTKCPMPKQQLGVFVPRQQVTAMISVEYKGKEKITLKGGEVELDRFDITGELGEWNLWMDNNRRLVRVVMPSDSTEVVRE